jgi:hypothetical protein
VVSRVYKRVNHGLFVDIQLNILLIIYSFNYIMKTIDLNISEIVFAASILQSFFLIEKHRRGY